MLKTAKRKDFEVLNDIALIWCCIEPTIEKIRGKNFTIKSEFYSQLNPGQRALLMVQMLYGHTSTGVEEFYSHQSYLLSNRGVWSQLKKGLQYFGDFTMVRILEKMDIVFQSLKTEEFEENAELTATMSLLNQSLRDALPLTLKLVAAYIRNNAEEFVQFID